MKGNRLFSLSDKVAMITGGAGYLGTAMTRALLEMGSTVAIADITNPTNGIASAEDRYFFTYCDVSESTSIKTSMEEINNRYGKIDILINNATYGAGYGPAGTVEAMTDADWARGIDGAAGTCFRCIREVIPYFKQNQGGVIVNMASMYGIVSPDPSVYGTSGANNPVNYGAGKAAVIQLTRYCAAHLAKYGIRVNSISPGPLPDPRKNSDVSFLNELKRKTMLGRLGKADDIAGAVIFLASPASEFVTGSNLVVDGGWTAW